MFGRKKKQTEEYDDEFDSPSRGSRIRMRDPRVRDPRTQDEDLETTYEWNDSEQSPKKAPLIFRVLAWSALVMLFFAGGYGGMSLLFKHMESRGGRPGGYVATSRDVSAQVSSGQAAQTNAGRNAYSLFIPVENDLVIQEVSVESGIAEDEMAQILDFFLTSAKEGDWLDSAASNLQIFRSGEWLYLNMNGAFLKSLKDRNADKARLLLTGLVKTMSENFPPVLKVKFYIDGKEALDKKPVDLSRPWQIPKGA